MLLKAWVIVRCLYTEIYSISKAKAIENDDGDDAGCGAKNKMCANTRKKRN